MVTERVEIIITERGARTTSRGIRRVGTSSRTAASSVRLLTGALAGLGAALSVRELVRFADAAIQVNNRIKVVTNSVEEFNAVQNELRNISTSTRTELGANAALFQRLRTATRDLGTSNRDVLATVRGLNAAIAVSGSSSQEAASGLQQLAQGLASGRFQGDELRSVIENLNPLAQRLADELGVTVGELRELGAEGKLTAETVFPALLRATADFEEQLAGIDFTVAQTFNLLQNALTTAIGDLNQIIGATDLFNNGIIALAQNLRGGILEGFAVFADISAEVAEILDVIFKSADALGVEVLPTLGQTLGVVGSAFLIFFGSVNTGIQSIRTGVNAIVLGVQLVGNAFGAVDDAVVQGALNDFNDAQGDLTDAAFRLEGAFGTLGEQFTDIAAKGNQTETAFDGVGESLRGLAATSRAAIDAVSDFDPAILDLEGENVITPEVDTAALKEAARLADLQAKAQAELLALTRDRRLEDLGAINEREVQIALIDEEIARVVELQRVSGDRILGEQEINRLIAERADLASQTDFGQNLSTGITTALETGFANAVREGGNLFDGLADSFAAGAQNALIEGFSGGFDALQEGLGGVFDSVANAIGDSFGPAFEGVAGAFGDVLSGVLQFVALQALSALFGGGGNESSSSSGNVSSAVTSTETVRGIVAGPQEIAIAQVDRAIGEAFAPATEELRTQTGLLRAIIVAIQTSGGSTGVDGDTAALAFGSAPAATL